MASRPVDRPIQASARICLQQLTFALNLPSVTTTVRTTNRRQPVTIGDALGRLMGAVGKILGVVELAVVVTVTVSVAGVEPLTLGDCGATVQEASEGAPVQLNETVPLKPKF